MEILRYAAFSTEPSGGNPAGVVLDASGATDTQMQQVAADVGFSETAFYVDGGDGHVDVRYFSPLAEVPFCGHATIASAVAHAERHGPGALHLNTRVGRVEVTTSVRPDGFLTATLTSVAPRSEPITDGDLGRLLDALGWSRDELDPDRARERDEQEIHGTGSAGGRRPW